MYNLITQEEVDAAKNRKPREEIGSGVLPTLKYYTNSSYLFGCATGFGKSWFAAMEAVKFASQGKRVVVIETELVPEEMIFRLSKCQNFDAAIPHLSVVYSQILSVEEIKKNLLENKECGDPIDLLILDHIGAASIETRSADVVQNLLQFGKYLDNLRSEMHQLTLICYTQTTGGSKVDRTAGKQHMNMLTYQYCSGLDQSFDFGCIIDEVITSTSGSNVKKLKIYVNKDRYAALTNSNNKELIYSQTSNTVREGA